MCYKFTFFFDVSRYRWMCPAHRRSHLLLPLSQHTWQFPLFLPRQWLHLGGKRAQLPGWALCNVMLQSCGVCWRPFFPSFGKKIMLVTFKTLFCLSDIDECVTGSHTCTENQSCFNVQGGFRCLSFECPNNYRRVGETWVFELVQILCWAGTCLWTGITMIVLSVLRQN